MTIPTRILIVDDNESIHDDFRALLSPDQDDDEIEAFAAEYFGDYEKKSIEAPDYDLAHASCSEEALSLMRNEHMIEGRRFAMAFVDVRMPPGLDGIETIERMWIVDPSVQMVICTAYSDYGLDDIQKRLGVSDRYVIIKKPFDPTEIQQLASAMTAKWHRERQLDEYCDHLKRVLRERTFMLEDATIRLKEGERVLVQNEKLASIGQLAAGVAHEISTPISSVDCGLSALGAQIETLRADLSDDSADVLEQMEETIEVAQASSRMVLEIARSLQNFARVSDSDELDWDVNESIEASLRILTHELKDKCNVQMELAEDLPTIRCSPGKLNQVFLNLLKNGIQALDGKGELSISSSHGDDRIVVEISDNGAGIAPEDQANIFEPFFTTKEPGHGTGLGLSIVRDIVTGMGGAVSMESTLGEGTTFRISLPTDR